jgi:hypothetical protein
VFWSLKLLLAAVILFFISMIPLSLLPKSTEENVGTGVVLVGMVAAVYLIATCLLNLIRAWFAPHPGNASKAA